MGGLTRVTVSDRCKALCVMEAERKALFDEAAQISRQQRQAIDQIAHLSQQHKHIITKLAALETAAASL